MRACILVSVGAFLVLGFWSGSCPSALAGKGRPSANAPFLLEKQYEQETDPRDRVEIAIELMEVRFRILEQAYKTQAAAERETAVENYRKASGMLENAVTEAVHVGSSKKAEVLLRRQRRRLENLQMGVSYFDRASLEPLVARVAELREDILYSIMNPEGESAEQGAMKK